jgi:hypothetical protein
MTQASGCWRFSHSILRAIAVLGVNPEPLRGRLARTGAENGLRREALARRGLTPALGDGVLLPRALLTIPAF